MCKRVSPKQMETVRFSEKMMSADKYTSLFSPQMEAVVFLEKKMCIVFLQIFFATRIGLKIEDEVRMKWRLESTSGFVPSKTLSYI